MPEGAPEACTATVPTKPLLPATLTLTEPEPTDGKVSEDAERVRLKSGVELLPPPPLPPPPPLLAELPPQPASKETKDSAAAHRVRRFQGRNENERSGRVAGEKRGDGKLVGLF